MSSRTRRSPRRRPRSSRVSRVPMLVRYWPTALTCRLSRFPQTRRARVARPATLARF
jgi:hypothetical protein